MLNVYVLLRVRGVPDDLFMDDAFADAMFEALPDVCLAGDADGPYCMLSQFSLSDAKAAAHQAERLQAAFAAAGHPDAIVTAAEVEREGWRDDLLIVRGAIRWHAARLIGRS